MHALRIPALIVLLLLPGTSWQGWQSAALPHLRAVVRTGAIAVMTARTAETRGISAEAGARTILAGARMDRSPNTAALDHPALDGNVVLALGRAGYAILPQDTFSRSIVGAEAEPPATKAASRRFVVAAASGSAPVVDAAVAHWVDEASRHGGVLLIASPNPSDASYREFDRLTPVVLWRPNGAAALLRSPSTRRPGLIVNTDIAATIASLAGAALPGPSYGFPAVAEESANPIATVTAIDDESQTQEREQRGVPYVAAAVAALIALVTWFRLSHPSRGCLALSLLPPAICASLLALPTPLPAAALIAGFAIAAVLALKGAPRSSLTAPAAIAAVAAAYIFIDAVLGHCAAIGASLLGYSPAEGARYYGLGDEAMGALAGACVLIAGTWPRADGRLRTFVGAGVWLAAAGVLGLPQIGAKAGGLLVALLCLAAFVIAERSTGKAARRTVVWAAIGALSIGVAALIALGRVEGSHVSQTVAQAHRFGLAVIWSVIRRKLAMDLHLMGHSVWMVVLAAAAIGAWLTTRRSNSLGRPDPNRVRVMLVGSVATAACLALNDAGVVAAALCSVFVWSYAAAASPARCEVRA